MISFKYLEAVLCKDGTCSTETHIRIISNGSDGQIKNSFVLLGSKPYDSLTVGEFLAHTFHIDDSLFILLRMWVSYSPGESLGILVAPSLTRTPETKHSPTKRHRTNNAAYNQCQWNWQWRSDEETKPSERVSIVISCDSHAST